MLLQHQSSSPASAAAAAAAAAAVFRQEMEGGDGKMSPRESNNNNSNGGSADSKPTGLPTDPAAFAALAAAAAAGGFPPGFPPVSSASAMFPFPFHPSMLASLATSGNLGAASERPAPRAATPPPPPPTTHSPRPVAKDVREEDEAERLQRRLRHESSAKDDEAGKSRVQSGLNSIYIG